MFVCHEACNFLMDVEIKLFFDLIYLFSLGIFTVKDTEINDSGLTLSSHSL